MVRPCYLVVDQEHALSISTRKLVIETAKLNVITAYSSLEAIDTLKQFPAVSGVVLDANMPDMSCEDLVRQLKAIRQDVPIVVVGEVENPENVNCDGFLNSFDPRRLLSRLQELNPAAYDEVQKQDVRLADKDAQQSSM